MTTSRVKFCDAPYSYKRIYALKKKFDTIYFSAFKSFIKKNDPKHWYDRVDWHPWDEIGDICDYRRFNSNQSTYISSGHWTDGTYFLNLKTGVLCCSKYMNDVYYYFNKRTGEFDKR